MELGARGNCMYSNVAIKRAEKGFDGGGGGGKKISFWRETSGLPKFFRPGGKHRLLAAAL